MNIGCISREFCSMARGTWQVKCPFSRVPNLFFQNSASQPGFHQAINLIPLWNGSFWRISPYHLEAFISWARWQGQKGEWTWSTLPETNRQFALENHHRNPDKYHQNGGFSMAMLAYRSVYEYVIIQLSPGKSRCQHITFKLPSQKFGRWGVPFQRWGSSFSLPGI